MRGKFVLGLLALVLATALFAVRGEAASSDPISRAAEANRRCLTCHPSKEFTVTFQQSNHKALACTDCHSWVHGQSPETGAVEGAGLGAEPGKVDIAGTREWSLQMDRNCRTCHAEADRQVANSAHGTVAAGSHTAVQCADCHGSHNIFKAADPRSAVNRRHIEATCSGCHDPKVAESYRYSFHGSAVRLGDKRSATCVDCHGAHDILPQDDPGSLVSAANLPGTCAKCHVKPQANFARGVEHTTVRDRAKGFPLWLTWKIFLIIILLDVVKDAVLITLELLRKWRQTGQAAHALGRDSHD